DGRMSVSSVNGLGLVFCRTIPGLDACGEENFDGFRDTGDIDATESLLDIGMKTEEEELGEESPNEEHCEQNSNAEHVVFGRAHILEMEFANPDEVCRFYEQYSRAKGFGMRQGKKLKNRNGEIVRYTYLCNREGFRDRKWLEVKDRKREHKVVTRCGCQAEMRIKRKAESNNWYVCRFVDEHNHDLLPAKFVSYLPAYRKLSDVDRAHMDSLRQVGISIPKIYESITAQAGGFNLVTFTKRDMYNVVRRQRAMQSSDVNAVLRYFNVCARRDGNMY
ncbi:hypothetical protein HN873_043322, partial [Arachis hypogaea]